MAGDSETEFFWAQFLRHLCERGPSGVRPVVSDSHSGLVKAIRKVMLGATWQRCRAHFVRNVFAVVPKGSAEMAAATIRTVFAQPTADAVRARLDTVADLLGRQFPKVQEVLLEATEDLTASADFPHQHGKKSQSTNPLDRLNPALLPIQSPGLRRGRPRRPRINGTASTSGRSWGTSCRFPPVGVTADGVPSRSTIRWCFEPGRARSTGEGAQPMASAGPPRQATPARSTYPHSLSVKIARRRTADWLKPSMRSASGFVLAGSTYRRCRFHRGLRRNRSWPRRTPRGSSWDSLLVDHTRRTCVSLDRPASRRTAATCSVAAKQPHRASHPPLPSPW
ncbi:hypothetical protein RKD28_000252 [Streptomyces sp. SAI-229]|jgi:hypothetical protein